MKKNEKEQWLNTETANLFVSGEYYHHHAFEILNTHTSLKDSFLSALNAEIHISPRIKKTKSLESRAIKADALNVNLRKLLLDMPSREVKLEVVEERGVFYFASEKSSIGGFDFAFINHKQNILALRNLCFGQLSYHDGLKRWKRFLSKNSDLQELADEVFKGGVIGEDLNLDDPHTDTPLIVGEIQFGNWALAYRDFFKVLKANVQNSIDCLVYIVPTGNLESSLSDGIVTFDKTVKIIKDFEKVINVPVWVIGLDID